MKKDDLVQFERLSRHSCGVGWKFHKDIGTVIRCDTINDAIIIITKDGRLIELPVEQCTTINPVEKEKSSFTNFNSIRLRKMKLHKFKNLKKNSNLQAVRSAKILIVVNTIVLFLCSVFLFFARLK